MELVNDFLYYDEEAADPGISPNIISIADLITSIQNQGISEDMEDDLSTNRHTYTT